MNYKIKENKIIDTTEREIDPDLIKADIGMLEGVIMRSQTKLNELNSFLKQPNIIKLLDNKIK
jgi:hypothetical protein